jgi:ribonuclease HI
MEIVNGLIKELQIIMGLELNEKNHHQPIQTIRRWYAQERGQYKINVDAAIARQGDNGAIGAICRDDHGEYVAASARVTPHVTEPETLEAIACSEALALAEDCGFAKLIVVSDCLNVIRNINKMPRCPYIMILQEIYEKSKSFEYVRFVQNMEYNREAHALAKYACTLGARPHI